MLGLPESVALRLSLPLFILGWTWHGMGRSIAAGVDHLLLECRSRACLHERNVADERVLEGVGGDQELVWKGGGGGERERERGGGGVRGSQK